MENRFENWEAPEIEDNKPTKYNWVVRHPENFKLGSKTDIGAFTYINASHGITIEEDVQIGSHCSIYSESTIGFLTTVNYFGHLVHIILSSYADFLMDFLLSFLQFIIQYGLINLFPKIVVRLLWLYINLKVY